VEYSGDGDVSTGTTTFTVTQGAKAAATVSSYGPQVSAEPLKQVALLEQFVAQLQQQFPFDGVPLAWPDHGRTACDGHDVGGRQRHPRQRSRTCVHQATRTWKLRCSKSAEEWLLSGHAAAPVAWFAVDRLEVDRPSVEQGAAPGGERWADPNPALNELETGVDRYPVSAC